MVPDFPLKSCVRSSSDSAGVYEAAMRLKGGCRSTCKAVHEPLACTIVDTGSGVGASGRGGGGRLKNVKKCRANVFTV